MSKNQLKKELANLNRDQLVQLVLDLYSARKEAKTYFDFFVNPDVDALYEKFRKAVEKEIDRGKYRRCTARISRIRSTIKEFASFDPGAEYVVNLMIYTVKAGIVIERRREISRPFFSGIGKLCADVLEYADKHEVYTSARTLLETALNGETGYLPFINYLRRTAGWAPLTAKPSM